MNSSWRSHESLRTLYVLFLGQIVSLLLAVVNFAASLIANLGVDASFLQLFFQYAPLALVYGSIFLYRRRKLEVSWYWYLLLGFFDVQGKFLATKAFQFTSITNVTLLSCWTIAWVIILTWIFLGTRYSLWQLLGAATCVSGLGLVILSDSADGAGAGGGSKPILGDSLVIAGTILYAVSTVSQEFCVKKKDYIELLCMIGVFGLLLTSFEILLLERKGVQAINWSTDIVLAFAGVAFTSFLLATIMPYFLKVGGATLLNLSVLTTNMWAVLIRIFFYRQQVDWTYYVAFAVVVIGLVIYSTMGKIPTAKNEEGDSEVLQQLLIDENEASSYQ